MFGVRRDLAVGGRVCNAHRAAIWCSGRATGRSSCIFFFFLAVLSVSFVGSAIWVGFDPGEVARGSRPRRDARAGTASTTPGTWRWR